jgi:prenylcysteine oxidase/farnesylcysteine lyase
VKEGNAAMAVAMLQAAEARFVLNVTVGSVQIMVGGGVGKKKRYRVLREDGQPVLVKHAGGEEEEQEEYDAVVIATPFAFSKLAVIGLENDQPTISDLPPKEFTTTHATFIQGRVRPGFFGPSTLQQHRIPSSVYVVENASVPISSLSLHITLNATDGTGIYKLFSSALLEDSFVDALFFSGWEELHHREWQAYPSYHPPEKMTPFLIQSGERLCYVNALETAVSAMEISAIAAKNCALLLAQSLLGIEERDIGKTTMKGHAEKKEEL